MKPTHRNDSWLIFSSFCRFIIGSSVTVPSLSAVLYHRFQALPIAVSFQNSSPITRIFVPLLRGLCFHYSGFLFPLPGEKTFSTTLIDIYSKRFHLRGFSSTTVQTRIIWVYKLFRKHISFFFCGWTHKLISTIASVSFPSILFISCKMQNNCILSTQNNGMLTVLVHQLLPLTTVYLIKESTKMHGIIFL